MASCAARSKLSADGAALAKNCGNLSTLQSTVCISMYLSPNPLLSVTKLQCPDEGNGM